MVHEGLTKQRAIDVHHEQADLFRARYEEYVRNPYNSAFSYGRRKVDQGLDRYLPASGAGLRLLDAGCGSGFNLHTLAARGFECYGLDAAPGMVEHARSLNPGMDIRLGDVEQLPYEGEEFDYLISIEVIRYLVHPGACVRELHRVLKPGGTALVTAMPPYSLTAYPLLNRLTRRVQVGDLTRVQQFFHSVEFLRQVFREAGFSQVEVSASFWGPWRNLERLAPGLMPRLLRAWEPFDTRLERFPALRNFSNHLLIAAVK